MYQVYFAMRIYPWWAIPVAMIVSHLAIYCRRRKYKAQYPLWGVVAYLGLTAFFWVIFRGDIQSDRWVRAVFG